MPGGGDQSNTSIEGAIDFTMGLLYLVAGYFGKSVKWVYTTAVVLWCIDTLLTIVMLIAAGKYVGIPMKIIFTVALIKGMKAEPAKR